MRLLVVADNGRAAFVYWPNCPQPLKIQMRCVFVAIAIACSICSMVAAQVEMVDALNGFAREEVRMDGPPYLQHMQALILCIAECERLIYISNGDGLPPHTLLMKLHVFSNHSDAPSLNKFNSTEPCKVEVVVRRNGVMYGSAELQLPHLYHILEMPIILGDHDALTSTNIKLQTLVHHFDVEIASWLCARHPSIIEPPVPVRIGFRTVRVTLASVSFCNRLVRYV
jgi:hypothetical protein